MVKKGLSCAERQRRAGGAKKPQQRKGGAKKPQPRRSTIRKAGRATGNRACILKDLRSALSQFGLRLSDVLFVCDISNQKWFPKWFERHATKHNMRCIGVISSYGLFLLPDIPKLLTIKGMDVCVVGDGSCADGERPGKYEDPYLGKILHEHGPVVLVSGDGNMDPTKSHIYDAVCLRIQQGLKTIVLASDGSIHENLQTLGELFSGCVKIVTAHP